MTMVQVDFMLEGIRRADREALRKARRYLAIALDRGDVTRRMFDGINKDIRDRADWLRKRGK